MCGCVMMLREVSLGEGNPAGEGTVLNVVLPILILGRDGVIGWTVKP